VLTGFGRGLRLTERSAERLTSAPDVLEMDVTDPDQVRRSRLTSNERWGALDGVLHAVAFAPGACLGGGIHGCAVG
jgi:meromycolic acid enoyl-[acyl-carrier-protein] reductase